MDTENKEYSAILQNEKYNPDENNTTRSTLAQYIASWTFGLSLLTTGMMLACPIVAIGEFRQSNHDLSLTEDEASWFGSLILLPQPPCSVLGGILQSYIGRKHGMVLAFVLQLVGWLLLCSAKSVPILYVSVLLFGVSAGSMETPRIAYLGEILQPRLRGKLTSSLNILFSFGLLVSFLLSSIFTWRIVATICTAVPVVCLVLLFFIPESPMWLLNQGKKEGALKALCWLRGWASSDCVQLEYKYLCDYTIKSKHINNDKPESKQSFCKKLKKSISIFTNPAVRRPFVLIAVSNFASISATLSGMRSYQIEILHALQIPIQPEILMFVNCVLMLCGGMICFLVINILGKRLTLLFSLMTCSLICIILSWYSYCMDEINWTWIPAAAILLLHLAMSIGLMPIPWVLASEVFPLKERSVCTGLTTAFSFTLGFLFSKTFYSLKNIVHLSGCFLLYGLCGLFGFVYLYVELPETEGKTLAEIEEYFSGPTKKPKLEVA